jgi:hypothetical protein
LYVEFDSHANLLVEVDSDSLVKVAEGAEVFGKCAARQKLTQAGRGAKVVVISIHNHGVWFAVALKLVAFAEIPAFGHQTFHLAFGEVTRCHGRFVFVGGSSARHGHDIASLKLRKGFF